ncbi:hypothetical protein BM221_002220 [Beauveria bassiana]|uniref:Nudix hydrolase domain-containing protein n=1 Tax=Beauveria bassiana TaxID=176275 RepID=A0A2N6NXW9_BEABA|nr:hypothetical protein BM221_002220 [Beauveria bassiana]
MAGLQFRYHPSVADFAVPKRDYLAAHADGAYGYVATSAIVVDRFASPDPRVLLLQRAAGDSDPNLWEPAGGACEDDDASILCAVARELSEEAGLEAAFIVGQVGKPHLYLVDNDTKKVCQFNFVVLLRADDEAAVKLDPDEHQRFVWATKAEVEARRVESEGIDLAFTREEVCLSVLQAFDYCPLQSDTH